MNDDIPPRDVVRPELTREAVVQLNALCGQDVQFHEPGEVICDVDGIPNAVEPPTTSPVKMSKLMITSAEADRLGITEGEFKHVRIYGE